MLRGGGRSRFCSACRERYHVDAYRYHIHNRKHLPIPSGDALCRACKGYGLTLGAQAQHVGGASIRCPSCLGSGLQRLQQLGIPTPTPSATRTPDTRWIDDLDATLGQGQPLTNADDQRGDSTRQNVIRPGPVKPTWVSPINAHRTRQPKRSARPGRIALWAALAAFITGAAAAWVTDLGGIQSSAKDALAGTPVSGPLLAIGGGLALFFVALVLSRTARRWTRKLATICLVALAGFYALLTLVHLSNGFAIERSLSLPVQDTRMAVTCYDRIENVWHFINRKPGHDVGLQQDLEAGIDIYTVACDAGYADGTPHATPVVTHTPTSLAAAPQTTRTPTSLFATPVVTRTPTSLFATPVVTRTPTSLVATPEAARTPTSLVEDSTIPLRHYMVSLINADRVANGLTSVVLGVNGAAQQHAEDMLAHAYISHWDSEGLKPYMRYTQFGGEDYEAENVYRSCYVIGSETRRDLQRELTDAEQGFMESPGHRDNILNPLHTAVNIGIAYDAKALSIVQQFEGDYIDFVNPPTIINGTLRLVGETKLGHADQIQVWFEQLPLPLSRRQLLSTHSYSLGAGGLPIAFVRPPPPAGAFYPDVISTYRYRRPTDPYTVINDGPELPDCPEFAPSGTFEAASFATTWVTARSWSSAGNRFDIEADLSELVTRYGAGVYTIVLWSDSGLVNAPMTNYSIIVGG